VNIVHHLFSIGTVARIIIKREKNEGTRDSFLRYIEREILGDSIAI